MQLLVYILHAIKPSLVLFVLGSQTKTMLALNVETNRSWGFILGPGIQTPAEYPQGAMQYPNLENHHNSPKDATKPQK